MGGINLNESGLDFVRQVFVTFGGNTTVLTLFLLSVLYLALKGKKEERYVFVTTAVFLAFTVYNPFAVKSWNVSAESISSGPSPRLPKETICFQFGYVKA